MNFSAKNTRMIPATPSLKSSLDTLMQASLEVEQGLRAAGRYSKDAKPKGKRGFVVNMEDDGSMSLTTFGDMQANVEEHDGWHNPGPPTHEEKKRRNDPVTKNTEAESYEMMAEGEAFKGATERSHAPSKRGGSFEPQHHEGRRNPVGDAAVQMREAQEIARQKQASMSDSMKRESRRQYERNAQIAADMKAASARQWGAK